MNLYTLYLLQHSTDDLGGVTDFGLPPGIREIMLGADGQVDPTFAAVIDQAPTLRWTSRAIQAHLDLIGQDGLAVSATPLTAWLRRNTAQGVRATGSVHTKMEINLGLAVPRQIRAAHNDPNGATIDYECIILHDGTNDPVVITEAQALPASDDEGVQQVFTCGQVSLNGTEVNGVQEIIVDFGIQVSTQGEKGLVWPTYAGIISRQPRITIRVLDPDVWADLGISGQVQAATDSEIYLRKVSAGGTRVIEATSEHIKLSMNAGRHFVDDVSGRHADWVTGSLVLTPLEEATTAPLVIDTACAIT